MRNQFQNPQYPNANLCSTSTFPFAASTPTLKTVYLAFEKEKEAGSIVQELSAARIFVAMNPFDVTPAQTKVVEVMVPTEVSNARISNVLAKTFNDLIEVACEYNTYRIGVPVTEFGTIATTLRKNVLRVNSLERVIQGEAFFTVVTSPSFSTENLVSCLNEAGVQATFIEPVNQAWNDEMDQANMASFNHLNSFANMASFNHPNTFSNMAGFNHPNTTFSNMAGFNHPNTTFNNPGAITGNNMQPTTMPFASRAPYVVTNTFPLLGNDLLNGGPLAETVRRMGIAPLTLWNNLCGIAECWQNGRMPNTSFANNPNNTAMMGLAQTASWLCNELCNPASAIAQCCRQMGLEATAIAETCMPFRLENNPAMTNVRNATITPERTTSPFPGTTTNRTPMSPANGVNAGVTA